MASHALTKAISFIEVNFLRKGIEPKISFVNDLPPANVANSHNQLTSYDT